MPYDKHAEYNLRNLKRKITTYSSHFFNKEIQLADLFFRLTQLLALKVKHPKNL
jgi:hypothetical protein